jgi:PKD repeat protein
MSLAQRSVLVWSLLTVVAAAGCDKVPLLAPTNTTIRLVASVGLVAIGGSIDITAVVIESAGTPVQNGTVVSFTSGLGTFEPREGRTQNGQVTVKFIAGVQSGTAKISAFSGGSKSDDLDILVGAAAVGQVNLRASNTTVPTTGGTITLTAQVVDLAGNPLRTAPVSFSTTAGTLSQSVALTNDRGEASSDLFTNVNAKVTAQVTGAIAPPPSTGGSGTTTVVKGEIDITAKDLPFVKIEVVGGPTATSSEVGLPTVFSLRHENASASSAIRSVRVDFGDGNSATLGALPGTQTVSHTYTRTGFYTVTVTATDALGLIGVTSMILQVNDRFAIPVTFTTSALSGGVINFSATATPRTGTTIRSYEWDFGDGSSSVTTGSLTTHRYNVTSPRTFRVTLRVTATNGDTGFQEGDIRVSP